MATEWTRGRGSAYRIQRNMYAWAVSAVPSGSDINSDAMPCPACLNTMVLGGHGDSAAEVDRVIPSLDYREGNVAYICRSCNESRSLLQTHGNDWQGIAQYQSDVASWSECVTVPTVTESKLWWQSMRSKSSETRLSRYA